ncbi:hypothetical protein [Luteolibacter sp. AS25]|uniref:hypothetical protein n=1 Tax=Luteolibacter sp. AS25 TaxID=3135776 RepID=UPI00398B1B3F
MKYTYLLLTFLFITACKKPVLDGDYETRKVEVMITHKGGGGGGAIDTDRGVSERRMTFSHGGTGSVKERYKVTKVTTTGFTLEYHMIIENPIGSEPRPFSGNVLVPYEDKIVHPITDDYTLTVWVP